MAQGEFTKEEATSVIEATSELFDGLPKNRRLKFLGHLNDIMLFLEEAKRKAPDQKE